MSSLPGQPAPSAPTIEPRAAADGADLMRRFLPYSPFVQLMGAVLIEIGDGQVKLRLPFRDDLVTVGSMVHGGAIAAVADFGVMVAAWAGLDIPEKVRGVTVSLSVDYIEPAIAEDLDIVGTRLRTGRRLQTCSVDVLTAVDGRLVARALGVYKVG
ncbi:PaaI family thioesterase [Nocardia cyriacigeorgica]|uniref:PaaI family thioesterase n=1 Tax=Nocardia cyriacigeorgica TaxID=135487 RepID=UPI001894AA2F|nr:PaaI family thioesterase [Nocardia cyriacigeorgica]MBF6321355.1 PaaI family thioesterase [Nocardia cyriacigeorgica]